MSNLKDLINKDISIFFSTDEFGEDHNINGAIMTIVVDDDRLKHRSKVEYEGIIVGDILYFAQEKDFIKAPKVDGIQIYDGIPCTVFDVRSDKGVYEIILKKTVS